MSELALGRCINCKYQFVYNEDQLVCPVCPLSADIERLTTEVSRLTMMLDEYVRLDNAGKIPLEPVGGADSSQNS